MRMAGSVLLDVADTLLFIPGLLMYFYTGVRNCDSTIASTSQIFDLLGRTWSDPVVQAFGIPPHVLPEVTDAGTIVGELAPSVRRELRAPALKVVTPGGHDTACAVASVPAAGSDYIYLSCGTWSLMGIEESSPIINELTEEFSFTNEGGVCNTVRLLKNIAGLWPIQECRRVWEREGVRLSYDEITAEASAAAAFSAFIDPDDSAFLNPPHMPKAIQDFCRRTGQKVPQSRGEIVRAALEGLALKYRFVADRLERVAGRSLDTIHMVGGGINNRLLCRMAADASGRRVVAGPVEATAIGNVLMQAMALGEIGTLGELREVVRNSFATEVYEPSDTAAWDDPYERFTGMLRESAG
jgi:rhamnulokinase